MAHLFGWIFQFLGALVFLVLMTWAIVGAEPKHINQHLDRLEPAKPTRMERLRAWAQR